MNTKDLALTSALRYTCLASARSVNGSPEDLSSRDLRFASDNAAKIERQEMMARLILDQDLLSMWLKLIRVNTETGETQTILFLVMSSVTAKAYLKARERRN